MKIELTNLEQAAIFSVLLERYMDKDGNKTIEWIDVANEQVVSIEDLIAKFGKMEANIKEWHGVWGTRG